MPECQLRLANGTPDVLCDEAACVFWRVAGHLDVESSDDWTGCAIQHFALLDGGAEISSWLLSAKERALADATRAASGR